MDNIISELYNELIETKKQFLEEIEAEICMIGELSSTERPLSGSGSSKPAVDMKTKMEKIRLSEEYINDIDIEMELIASYLELEEKVKELKRIIDDELNQNLRYKKQYEDLANSKLGRIQRFWWRITRKKRAV